MTVYVMVGLPGSGKSTWITQHSNAAVVCPDAIRAEWYGDAIIQGDGAAVFQEAYKRVDAALAKGQDVIFDATNTTQLARRSIINNTHAQRYVAVFMDTPLSVCKIRNAQRDRHVPNNIIERMAHKLTKPTIKEDFNEVITVS